MSPRPSSPSKKTVTIREVALRAGVSPQTVSNTLNGKHTPRTSTRERVDEAVRELGYQLNAPARALRSRRSENIALLLEDPDGVGLHDQFHADYVNGAVAAAQRARYGLYVGLTSPGRSEEEALRLVQEKRVDGVILSLGGFERSRRTILQALLREGVPVVIMHQQVSEPGLFTVGADDEMGARTLTEHLIQLGHRRLAFLCGQPVWPAPRRRRDAIIAAARKARVEVFEWGCSEYTIDAARQQARKELSRRGRPTAILAGNDQLALGVIQAAGDLGLDVPRELSVTGFNDASFASWVQPPITTVRIPGSAMAAQAIELVVSALHGSDSAQSVLFQSEVLIRDSTAAAPSHPKRRA